MADDGSLVLSHSHGSDVVEAYRSLRTALLLSSAERLRTAVKGGVDYHPYLPREDGRLPMSDFGDVHRFNVTGLYHDMWGFPTDKPELVQELLRHLIDKIERHRHEIEMVDADPDPGARPGPRAVRPAAHRHRSRPRRHRSLWPPPSRWPPGRQISSSCYLP